MFIESILDVDKTLPKEKIGTEEALQTYLKLTMDQCENKILSLLSGLHSIPVVPLCSKSINTPNISPDAQALLFDILMAMDAPHLSSLSNYASSGSSISGRNRKDPTILPLPLISSVVDPHHQTLTPFIELMNESGGYLRLVPRKFISPKEKKIKQEY